MQFENIESFMAIGAHCDDVDLRCGGTFSRLVRQGARGCYMVCVENAYTDGSFDVASSQEALAVRRQESIRAAEFLGAERLEWLGLKSFYFSTSEPDSCIIPSFDSLASLQQELTGTIMEGLPQVICAGHFAVCRDRLRTIIEEQAPQVIFTHAPDDRHIDHFALARFVDQVVKAINDAGGEIELYYWEPGSMGPLVDFVPDTFVELAPEDVERKQRASDCYRSQFPPNLIDDWAVRRAAAYGRLVGKDYAEVFRRAGDFGWDDWRDEPPYYQNMKQRLQQPECFGL